MINMKKFVFILLLISATACSLFEDDDCVVAGLDSVSNNGKCKSIYACDYAKKLLLSNKRPQTCGFNGNIPLVCCPTVKPEIAELTDKVQKVDKVEKPQKIEIKNEINKEGDSCTAIPSDDNLPAQNGKCVNSSECDYEKGFELLGGFISNCKYEGILPLKCCPLGAIKVHQVFNTKAEKICFDYYDKSKYTSFVSGGKKAASKEFPHMAAIGYKSGKSVEWLCGGSFISGDFVLTAAHCTEYDDQTPNLIRLGDLDLQNTTEDAAPEDFTIKATYVHPEYKSNSHYHDIALFQLSRRQTFTVYIKPACLHAKKDLPTALQATGWGNTEYLGSGSSHLLKVTLKVTNYETCATIYNKTKFRKLKNGIIDDMQICAGGDSAKDTCPGDSGGPLHYLNPENAKMRKHFVVAGITSFGKGCGFEGTPGVYMRVSQYISWIDSIVWPSESYIS